MDIANNIAILTLFISAIGWSVIYLLLNKQQKNIHQIQELLSEQDTRFSHLYKRRTDTIDILYKTMDHLRGSLLASIRAGRFQGESSPEEQHAQAVQHFIAFQECFYQNRLYLEEELCTHIENLIQKCINAFSTVGITSSFHQILAHTDSLHLDTKVITSHKELMAEAAKIIVRELPPVQQLIEQQMRDVLGCFVSPIN
jgi:hypothetical protein